MINPNINLTNDQEKALEDMIKWTKMPHEKDESLFYLLSGYAGTGKTYLLEYFVEASGIKNVIATAPTHKAKKVVADKTGLPSDTVQKLLGLRPDVNMEFFNINRPVFNPLAFETMGMYRYVIIDESSMINKDAYELICKKAFRHGTRILFTGDSAQLPPIGEHISKVFTNTKYHSELSEIVRQEDTNPNLKLLSLIRQDIIKNTNKAVEYIYRNPSEINDKGEGYLAFKPNDFTKALVSKFCDTYAEYDIDYIRYLSYTNKSVTSGCKGIRNKRITDNEKPIVKEDFLLGYNTILIGDKVMLQNSEDYIIDKIWYDCESNYGIKTIKVNIKNPNGFVSQIQVVNPNDYETFLKIFRKKLKIAMDLRGKKWEDYYNFKNRHLLIDDLYKSNNKLEVKKDLYYGYGLTVHKSQGSTYKNVAINVKNILLNRDIRERNKLLYVALSRTSGLNILNI